MGQAVDIPLVHGAGWYIVMEQSDAYFCREAGVIADGAGRIPAGTVLSRLKADRTVNGTLQKSGQFVTYADGMDNACILWQGIDARVKGAKRTLTIRDTQVQASSLSFGFAATNPQLQTAYGLLAATGILMR